MHDPAPSSGVTYIGPRSFAIAFGATCTLFVALLFGVNILSGRFAQDAPPPVAAPPAGLPIVAATVASPPPAQLLPVVSTPASVAPVAPHAAARVIPRPAAPIASPAASPIESHAIAPIESHTITPIESHAAAASTTRVVAPAQARIAATPVPQRAAIPTPVRSAMPAVTPAAPRIAASLRVLQKLQPHAQANSPNPSGERAVQRHARTRLASAPTSTRVSGAPSSSSSTAVTTRLLVPFTTGARGGDAGALRPATPERGALIIVARPAPAPAAALPPAAAVTAPASTAAPGAP